MSALGQDNTTTSTSTLVFYVNGKKIEDDRVDPETTLLRYLRIKLCLTGTKLVCNEGGCGGCTVMVSLHDRHSHKIRHQTVNACIIPVWLMHGKAVTTVEGIGSISRGLHPVQERIAKAYGSQCGFCTPGMVMAMYTLLRNNPQPSVEEMERNFDGNLCRCTGYRPILDGYRTFTKEYCELGDKCCRSLQDRAKEDGMCTQLFDASTFTTFDPTQEPIFPPHLQLTDQYDNEVLDIEGERVRIIRPVSLKHLLSLRLQYPKAPIVVGNSEVGIETRFKDIVYPVVIIGTHVSELRVIQRTDSGLVFGSSVTLSEVDTAMKQAINDLPEHKCRVYVAFVQMMKEFAGHQIRNVAAIGGNIMTASPISDLSQLFLASGTILKVTSADQGDRIINMNKDFFVGYRKTAVKENEVLVSVLIPFTKQNEYFHGYKQAYRRDDDIAIVNAGMRVRFQENSHVVQSVSLSYGGMAPTTVMSPITEQALVGQEWDECIFTTACDTLPRDLPLDPGAPGGMAQYRRTLTLSMFFKFYLTVRNAIKLMVPLSDISATEPSHRPVTTSSQLYEEVASGQPSHDPVSRPIVPTAALQQATGEAVFVDDMPMIQGEKIICFVTSTRAHARVLSVEASRALAMPGVVGYVSHVDVPGSNMWGPIEEDEEVFASTEVFCQGQLIGGIVADTWEHAWRAVKEVEVEYQDLDHILTIQEAIAQNSFYGEPMVRCKGDVEKAFHECDKVLEGDVSIGGQEHFYMEPQVARCRPLNEDSEIEMDVSVQGPMGTQAIVANVLGVSMNKVTLRCKRLGGAFGGKETRASHICAAVAVAATRFKCPVRCALDRDADMAMTGTRHPFYAKYKVGYDRDGKIQALRTQLYANAGCSLDLSPAVIHCAVLCSGNAYFIPNCEILAYCCRTNIPSNTAFRGFGAPQGMLVCESWITLVAEKLSLSQTEIREINLIKEGELSCHHQVVKNCEMQRCWNECLKQSDFQSRHNKAFFFNRENRWKKRGICVIPTLAGCGFGVSFFNQAGALVHVYKDGSVLLAHGGVEMGQGLYGKMKQVASRALGISIEYIHTSETNTNCVPNATVTAGSVSSDLNGMAVLNACKTIRKRLEPYIHAQPKGSWNEWVHAAYYDRCSLSSTGFYKVPHIDDKVLPVDSKILTYFTFGAACSEVEIDCLTGDHQVLRTDIVMDVGTSLNPCIDIGQIEGAFTQGYGLMMLEEQKYSPSGYLLSRGPGTYKIPSFHSIPTEMNVSLLKGSSNPRAVYSSKAIGEPPLFLAASVFFAVREAIKSARADHGLDDPFRYDSPATPEKIRLLCADRFTEQFPAPEPGSFKPFYVQLS